MSNLDTFLASAPRKELLSTLIKLGGHPSYDAPSEVLAQQIKERVQLCKDEDKNASRSLSVENKLDKLIFIAFFGGILVCIVLLLVFLISRFLPHETLFCHTNQIHPGKCVRCPSQANCTAGKAVCNDGFRLVHHSCIIDDGDALIIGNMVEKEVALLRKQAGLYKSAYSNEEGISRNDLIIFLISKNRLKNVDIEYLAKKAVDHLSYDTTIEHVYNDDIDLWVSKEYDLPFSFRVRAAIAKHLVLYLTISLIIAAFAIRTVKRRSEMQRKIQINNIANTVFKMYGETNTQLSSSHIIKKINKIEQQPDDIWRDVFIEMQKNKNCEVFPSQNGYMVKFK